MTCFPTSIAQAARHGQIDQMVELINQDLDHHSQPHISAEYSVANMLNTWDEVFEKRDWSAVLPLLQHWIVQASVAHRSAVLLNTEHMIGLQILSDTDDLELLRCLPDAEYFVCGVSLGADAPSREPSFRFLSHLLVTLPSSQCAAHLISSPAFCSLLGPTPRLHGHALQMTGDDISAAVEIVMRVTHTVEQAEVYTKALLNNILNNLHAPTVVMALEHFLVSPMGNAVVEPFLTDPRFQRWEKKDEVIDYVLRQNPHTLFPSTRNNLFDTHPLETHACNLMHALVEGRALASPQHMIEAAVRSVMDTTTDPVGVVRTTLTKMSGAGLLNETDVGILLGALTSEAIDAWKADPWVDDERFEVLSHCAFVKHTLENVTGSSQHARIKLM